MMQTQETQEEFIQVIKLTYFCYASSHILLTHPYVIATESTIKIICKDLATCPVVTGYIPLVVSTGWTLHQLEINDAGRIHKFGV